MSDIDAAAAGSKVTDTWEIEGFANGVYHLRVCGPNGFLREMAGDGHDPLVDVQCQYMPDGNVEMHVSSKMDAPCTVQVKHNAYGIAGRSVTLAAGDKRKFTIDLKKSFCWYDFSVRVDGQTNFLRRYAGRVETGKPGFSDPAMGRA